MIELTRTQKLMLLGSLLDLAETLDPIGVIVIQHGNVMLTAETFREYFLNKVWSVVRSNYGIHGGSVSAMVEIGEVKFWTTLDIETRQGGLAN